MEKSFNVMALQKGSLSDRKTEKSQRKKGLECLMHVAGNDSSLRNGESPRMENMALDRVAEDGIYSTYKYIYT